MSVYSINKDDLIMCLVAIILPPVPVIMRKGFWTKETLINILILVFLSFISIFHAWYMIYKTSALRSDEQYQQLQENLESGNLSPETQTEEEHAPPAYDPSTKPDEFTKDNKVQH